MDENNDRINTHLPFESIYILSDTGLFSIDFIMFLYMYGQVTLILTVLCP